MWGDHLPQLCQQRYLSFTAVISPHSTQKSPQMSNKCHIKNLRVIWKMCMIWIYIWMPLNALPLEKKKENERWVHSIKQREMHRDTDLCRLLWSMWHYHCISICLCRHECWCPPMVWNRAMSTFTYTHSQFSFFPFYVLHSHIHTQTMLEQHEISGACWDFFVHCIHGRMLEKAFIKGFNTSRVFSWRIFFWKHTHTQTQVTSMHAYSAKANIYTFLSPYHMLSLHSSAPTNKVLVNNQTHPSIYPSYLSWKPFQTKANVTTETSGFHSVP